ncbi:MAG: hypothetical protein ISQ14_09945 [Verrucomicrobiae bacterium]|nr:hypothetical protein [Verrucomicrobiae bacterium]
MGISFTILDPNKLERLSQMGPVAHLIGLLCLFVLVLAKVRRDRSEAFRPALTTGLIGVLIGATMLIAGMRVLGLKVLNRSELRHLESRARSASQGRAGGNYGRGGNRTYQNGKFGLVVLVRQLDTLTAENPAFLDERQAKAVLSLLEIVLPLSGYSDKEAGEMIDDLAARFTEEQRAKIRAASIPADARYPSNVGNPLQTDANRLSVMALIRRYDHLDRTVLRPEMLDF